MVITLGSLFDGSGGFPLAGSLCGIVPMWASEVEPYPIAVTRSRFPTMKHLGDISKINGAKITPVTIISFGSPCQDLSIAGKRAGLKHQAKGDEETTRSGLFMEAIRIIKEMRCATNGKYPQFAIFENVPGIFSSNKGEDFRLVLEEFIKITEPSAVMPEVPKGGWAYADSYCGDGWSLAWRVFNAQHWGVAQRRRRLYACFDLGGQRAREVLFKSEGLRGYFAEGKSPWQRTSSDAERSVGTNDFQKNCISFHLTQDPISGEKNTPCLSSGNSSNGQAMLGVCYGVDGYNSALVGETSSTLGINCGMSTGRCGVMQPIAFTDTASTLRAGAGAPKHLSDIVGRLACEKAPHNDEQATLSTPQILAYSFDSLSSNSMKSQNPYSGCRQVDVAKTLDTTNPSPSKNQGGMAVVQPVVVFEPRSQDGVPRLHKEVSPTLNTAQGGQRQPCVAMPTYCIQGNCIDRSDTAGCNGKGWREDSSFTLNTIDRPAIVYTADQAQGQSDVDTYAEISPMLTRTRVGEAATAHSISDKITVDQQFDTYATTTGNFMQLNKESSPTLAARDYKGAPLVFYWNGSQVVGTLTANNAAGNQRMPDKDNFNHIIQSADCKTGPSKNERLYQQSNLYCMASGQANAEICENQSPTLNCSSENPIIIEHAALQGAYVSEVPTKKDYKDARPGGSSNEPTLLSDANENSNAYHQGGFSGYNAGIGGTLKACGGDYGGGSENLIVEHKPHYIVRRLTPTECARLQGFPDRWGWPEPKGDFTEEEYRFWLDVRNTHALINNRKTKEYTKKQMLSWYNKLHSDSSEYKMWGNGVALPPTLYCMQGIYDVLSEA